MCTSVDQKSLARRSDANGWKDAASSLYQSRVSHRGRVDSKCSASMLNLHKFPDLTSYAEKLPKLKVSGVNRSHMTFSEWMSQCHVASSGDRNVPDTGSSLQLTKKSEAGGVLTIVDECGWHWPLSQPMSVTACISSSLLLSTIYGTKCRLKCLFLCREAAAITELAEIFVCFIKMWLK